MSDIASLVQCLPTTYRTPYSPDCYNRVRSHGNVLSDLEQHTIAHIWLRIISSADVFIAVPAILRFYGRSKTDLKRRNALTKIISFKIIDFVDAIQNVSVPDVETEESQMLNWPLSDGLQLFDFGQ